MRLPFLIMSIIFLAQKTNAHTPYFVPHSFEPVFGGQVTLDASFAEKFFVPEAAFNNGAYFVISPDGSITEPDTKFELKTRVVVEHKLENQGTYRFATGVRHGAVFRTYELDGERRSIRGAEEPLPEGAVLIDHFQSITQAESYVSKDGPTTAALTPRNEGLEIVPITHPNDLFFEDEFHFQILFQGKAMTGLEVTFHYGKNQFSESGQEITVQTNNEGKAVFIPADQGVYLMNVRHRADAPDGAPAPRYSHTTTLSLEAY